METTYLICIELSFAARKLESSGGSSLHRANASSKSPEAVNCTICKIKMQKSAGNKIDIKESLYLGDTSRVYSSMPNIITCAIYQKQQIHTYTEITIHCNYFISSNQVQSTE